MFRRNLLTGLLVTLPIVAALWVIFTIVDMVDSIFPQSLRPRIFDHPLPGLGLVTSLLIVFGVGVVARNLFGQRLVLLVEHGLARIPVFGKTYGVFKQVVEVVFGKRSDAFRRVVLVPFPHANTYTVAFVAGTDPEIAAHLKQRVVAVYVPTTPNPTSGYYIYVPEDQAIDLDIPVEQALKLVVTLGAAKTESGLYRLEDLKPR